MVHVENGAPDVTWKEFTAGKGQLAPRPQHYVDVDQQTEDEARARSDGTIARLR
jgi:hypothetical protein